MLSKPSVSFCAVVGVLSADRCQRIAVSGFSGTRGAGDGLNGQNGLLSTDFENGLNGQNGLLSTDFENGLNGQN